jgi:3-methyladenine DNA glycosylase/8-oxoguanine DNA glycosylase
METKEMTVKEYLSQAKFLDQRINSKIQQVAALNDLATKATSTLTGMPRNPNHATSTMEEAIAKIIDLQAEINSDIDTLVDLKRDLSATIKAVGNTEYQTVLEKRYLCFQSWEQIAVEMGYDLRWLYRIHGKALDEVQAVTHCE